MATGVLGDFVVELCDLDGVGIPAGREVEGMPESVVGLDGVFSENVVRGVAVVTGRGRVMARLQPGIVLRREEFILLCRRPCVRLLRAWMLAAPCFKLRNGWTARMTIYAEDDRRDEIPFAEEYSE